MNVTVHVAGPLRGAFDGRPRVELGLPSQADIGDVLSALFTLYPKLSAHLPRENAVKDERFLLRLLFDGQVGERIRMRDGARIFLVAERPRRLGDQAGGAG
ncbi:MAG: MoaD/ThiS family protein [Myxococcaceae bacterium]|nr:MoaD/ThiS family protein [Myxococcaceae bacterium]